MKKNTRFPWILAVFLCLYIILTSFAVTVLQHPAPPSEPAPAPLQPDFDALFASHFAAPDWESLYTIAGVPDTEFENSAAFAAYMEGKAGGRPLRYQQVHTENTSICRFLVYAGDEKLAAYTTSAPAWTVDTLELFFRRGISVTAEVPPEYTVCINGRPLDERFTVRTAQTKAEDYLPDGLHGYRRKWQTVSDLLVIPHVTALDETGQLIPLEQDAQTGIYRPTDVPSPQITEAEAAFARQAAIADARYAIADISNAQLREYFDVNSAVYKMLVTNPRNIQKHTSSSIDESSIILSEYCRYSDELFSVRVALTQNIIRTSGTLKVYQLEKTYFISTIDGEYRVTAYTNEHVTQTIEQNLLIFITDDGEIVQSVSGDAISVTTPPAEDLLGWATRTEDQDGNILMTIRVLPDGTILDGTEPMILYPVYP